jgi:class 3 adenylate cyclase
VRLSVTGVAILFTDLSGSTAIYETHGDATAFSVVHAHFALLREAIEQNGGTQVKTIGDAVMASFSDPLQSIRAGLAMQSAF